MTSGGRKRKHVAVGAAVRVTHALLRGSAPRPSGEPGSGVGGVGVDQLDRHHRPATADVADRRVLPAQRRRGGRASARRSRVPGVDRSSLSISSIAPRAAAQATGLPPYVPPRPPTCTESMSSARPVTAGERQAAGDALGGSHEVGHHALVRRRRTMRRCGRSRSGSRRPRTRRRAPGTTPTAPAGSPGAGTTKPPSPGSARSTMQARLAAAHLLVEHVDRRATRARRSGRRGTGRISAPGRPRRRTARSRACTACSCAVIAIVRLRAAVVGVVEDADRVATGDVARATLTAFSTASAPELNSADFLAWSPGVSCVSCAQTST